MVELVLTRIVPEFESKGLIWYADYAGGNSKEVGPNTIPLQRREGSEWAAVEITFDKRFRPWFQLHFALLPLVCKRLIKGGLTPVPRDKAIAIYAPAYFALRRARWSGYRDGQFGYNYLSFDICSHIRFALSPEKYLEREVDELLSLLSILFDIFEHGIREEWVTHDFGYISAHVMLANSWRLMEQRGEK